VSPQATDADLVETLLTLRRTAPALGAKKLLAVATVALARYDERHRRFDPLPIAVKGGRSTTSAGSAPALKNRKHNV
jgi:hypothetical protein